MATVAKLGLSEKQIVLRQSGIGASEIAAVTGIIPGAVAVWERKVGLAPEFEGNSLTEFGTRIERVLGEAWKDRHPGKDIFTPGTLRHPRVAIALASPDRIVVPTGRRAREVWEEELEMKVSFFSSSDFGEAGTDEVPERYLAQVQFQMEVCDLPKATLVALVNGDYREYPVARDRELGGMLLDAAQKFWTDHVETKTPPPVDGSEAYAGYIRRRFGAALAPPLPASPELEALVARYREAKEALDQADVFATEAKQVLQAAIGDAEGITGLCSWRNNKGSPKTDWEAVAKLMNPDPALVEKFTTLKPGARVLRLSKEK